MRYLKIAAVLVVLAPSSTALAQSIGGQLLCESEIGGGIFFDKTTSKWDSNGFRPEGKFVVTIKDASPPSNVEFGEDFYPFYEVEVAEFGTQALPCVTGGDFLFGSVKGMESGTRIACDTLFYTYIINPGTLRFLRVYTRGYIDGRDEEGNTPSVMAGKCARLN